MADRVAGDTATSEAAGDSNVGMQVNDLQPVRIVATIRQPVGNKQKHPALRRSKYRAKAVVIDGIRFASKKEGKRYEVLRDMQARGEIVGLKCHTSWKIVVRDILICRYIDDFNYTIAGTGGSFVVEDVKGWKTDVYKLKRKMMLAVHGIEILET